MSNQFISPNWHPLLIHYPLAFLSAGILIELLSFMWPRGFFRAAGRWMILLGALLTIPSMAAGLYALRTVVGGKGTWHDVLAQSTWDKQQWEYMRLHLLLNCIASGVVVIAVITWIADSDVWRRRLYIPVLLALIGGMGLFSVGAWYGGESVYRFGTAVHMTPTQTEGAPPASIQQLSSSHEIETEPAHHGIKYYIPPLELHIVLAGIVVAIGLGALALTLRRLEAPQGQVEPPETIGPTDTAVAADTVIEPVAVEEIPVAGAPASPVEVNEAPRVSEAPPPSMTDAAAVPVRTVYPIEPPVIHAGRFWLLTALAAIATAVVGLWSVLDVFNSQRLNKNWYDLTHPEGNYRLVLHVIFGSLLIILPLILASLARFGRRRRGFTGAFILLTVIAIGIQVWLGITLFYDTHQGPVYRFNPPVSVQQPARPT
jgi:uncharacterized membrane protein